MIFTSIRRALTASLAMFSTVFKTYDKRYGRFHSKEVLRTLLIPEFLIDRIN